jgi:FkbH-like protein
MMGNLSLSDIQRVLQTADVGQLPKVRISVLRNITIESLAPYLRYAGLEAGLDVVLRFGDFDNVVQESLGAQPGLLDETTDVVLVFEYLEALSPTLSLRYAEHSPEQVQTEVYRVQELIHTVLEAIRRQTPALILWHGFETPLHPALGIVDSNGAGDQGSTIAALNDFARTEIAALGGAYFVDLERCRGRVGEMGFYDFRYWHIGRAPYARDGLREIAAEEFKFIRALRGRNRKCLVLDCDNVLWGGIVGEDGLAGIKLSAGYPGSSYRDFQMELLQLYHRGVILTLNSKNNESDVWEVFDHHPDMVLRREHLAAWRINWQDKVSNLRELATELNIGLDSMVFADDSEFEVNMVRELLPEVQVIHLPVKDATQSRRDLAASGLFDTLVLSNEDRKRGALYQAEGERERLRTQLRDLDTYYASLAMKLDIHLSDEFTVPRIAQLTQKTNQFNMTTRRYTDSDIRRFVTEERADVICLHLSDRFGDSGLVGVAILTYHETSATFDTLLMSCRVLGRKVEDAFLDACLQLARTRGYVQAIGQFIPTAKNGLAADFFARHGFRRVEDRDEVERFAFDLTDHVPQAPSFFEHIKIDFVPNPPSPPDPKSVR